MTRKEAVSAICEVINSGIIDSELETQLTEACTCICEDDWDDCKASECNEYCEDCIFRENYGEETEEEFEEEPVHSLSVGVKPLRKI